ncbi:tol-pal system YbgF family protein [Rubritalea tangerina]
MLLGALLMAQPLMALEVEDAKLRRAVGLMQNEQWQLAYDVFSEIDTYEQAQGVSEGVYGKLLFSMGLCQMELAQRAKGDERKALFRKALVEFQRCRNFVGAPGDENPYLRRALLRMGMCYQALEDFDAAYAAYSQFLLERNQLVDLYDHGSLLINAAICAARKSQPEAKAAVQYLAEAIKLREKGEISTTALTLSVIEVDEALAGISEEQQSRMLEGWLKELMTEVQEDGVYRRLLAYASAEAERGDQGDVMRVLDSLPWIEGGVVDFDAEVDSALLVASVELLAKISGGDERLRHYQSLIEHFAGAERVESWLYQVVLAAVASEKRGVASEAIRSYLESYPEGAFVSEVKLIELSNAFDSGDYQKAAALAESYLAGETREGVSEEAARYFLFASAFYLADYSRCLELIPGFLERYPESDYLGRVAYYQGVSMARLGYAHEAQTLLEKVEGDGIADYAAYELAYLDFEFAQYESSQERLLGLLEGELEPSLGGQVQLLLARIQALLRQRDDAQETYLKALELARSSGDSDLEQEVTYHLIAFLGREKIGGEPNPHMDACIPYYDGFFEKFTDSEFASQVAAVALPALIQVGEGQRGIERLESVLFQSVEQMQEAGMREAGSALIWGKIDLGLKPSALRKSLLEEGLDSSYALVKWFALIEVYEAGLEQAQLSWGRKLRYDAIVRELYAQLVLHLGELSAPAYLRRAVGDWYLVNDRFPERAEPQFLLAQKSSLIAQQEWAQLGAIRARRVSGDVGAANSDLIMLGELIARSQTQPTMLERVLYEKIELLALVEKWDDLTTASRDYLSTRKLSYQRARVWYLLAKSYDLRGEVEDAIANYSRVFAGYTRVLGVSAPSVERLSELTWERNLPGEGTESSDKQVAYQLAHRYLTMVGDYPEWEKQLPGVKESLGKIRQNVTEWEASGEVISVEQMLREMRQGKR